MPRGDGPQVGCLDRTTLEWVRAALTGGGVTDEAGEVVDWLAGVLAALPSDVPAANNGAPSYAGHRLLLAERVCLAVAAGRFNEASALLPGWKAAHARAAAGLPTFETGGSDDR